MTTLDEHNATELATWDGTFTPSTNGIDCPLCEGLLEDTYPGLVTIQNPPQTPVNCASCSFTSHRIIDRRFGNLEIGTELKQISNWTLPAEVSTDFNKATITMSTDANNTVGSTYNVWEQNANFSVTNAWGSGSVNAQSLTIDVTGTQVMGQLQGHAVTIIDTDGVVGNMFGGRYVARQMSNAFSTSSTVTGLLATGDSRVDATLVTGITTIARAFFGPATVAEVVGGLLQLDIRGLSSNTVNVTDAYGLKVVNLEFDGATGTTNITNMYGMYYEAPSNAISQIVTNEYGLYIEEPVLGSTIKRAIHVVGGESFFGGVIQVTIADTKNQVGLIVNQNDITNNPNAATIINAGTGIGLFIDQNGNGVALNIDAESTTANVLNINSTTTTTGNVLNIGDASSLTAGNVARFSSASASPSARNILELVNINSASTGCTILKLEQNSAQTALFIDQNANGSSLVIDSESTTVNIIQVLSPATTTGSVIRITEANSLITGGRLLSLASNSADAGTRELIRLVNENTLATGTTCLEIQQDAANQAMIINQNAASSFIDYQGTAAANTTDPISTLTTSGATTNHLQIELNGVKAWVACSIIDPS